VVEKGSGREGTDKPGKGDRRGCAEQRCEAADEERAERPEALVHKEKAQNPSQEVRRRFHLDGGVGYGAKGDMTGSYHNETGQRKKHGARERKKDQEEREGKDADEDEFEATLLFMLGRLNNVVTTRQEPSSGEILGTCISMITVDTDKIVLATLVERAHCRNKRSYSHQVKKSSKREAATIHHWNKMMASRPISS